MSILKAMYSGAAGLGAHAKAIGVVSDNISNINTVGYKANRARFESVLGSTMAGARGSSGQGVRIGAVHANFVQGSIIASRLSTDMAIQGDGFFVVRGAYEGAQELNYYTRDGQFNVNAEGQLVNATGLVVQGFTADADENVSTTFGNISIPATSVVQPRPTSEMTVGLNLSPNTEFIAAFDAADPQTTSHFSTAVTIYDSLGRAHDANVFFNQTAGGTWEWNAVANGTELVDPANPTAALTGNVVIASGALSFASDGSLVSDTQNASAGFQFLDAGTAQDVAFDFGESTTEGGTGLEGTRQFDAPSAAFNVDQNGYGAGTLAGIKVNRDGSIAGTFTNGERRVLGMVAVAKFVNNDGLIRRDAGHWAESPGSGQALIGMAGSGGRGNIQGNSVEQSTVEIANEFVNIIAYQRGFQANSRSIRTADEMLTEAVNLKR